MYALTVLEGKLVSGRHEYRRRNNSYYSCHSIVVRDNGKPLRLVMRSLCHSLGTRLLMSHDVRDAVMHFTRALAKPRARKMLVLRG